MDDRSNFQEENADHGRDRSINFNKRDICKKNYVMKVCCMKVTTAEFFPNARDLIISVY